MTIRQKVMWLAALCALIAPIAGCAPEQLPGEGESDSSGMENGPAAEGEVPVYAFVADDYAYSGPSEIEGGVVELQMENAGNEIHHMQVVRLEEEHTLNDFNAALQGEGAGPPPTWITWVGGPGAVEGGLTSEVVLDLEPGNYALVCFVPDPQGVPHFAHGQVSGLTVTESEVAADEPEADIELSLADFSFDMPDTIAPGQYSIRATNLGEQDHEAQVFRLAEGATAEDLLSFLTGIEPAAEEGADDSSAPGDGAADGPAEGDAEGDPAGETPGPPGLAMGGTAREAPGLWNTYNASYEPGRYLLVCFVEDSNTGVPHFALGMLDEFTVE